MTRSRSLVIVAIVVSVLLSACGQQEAAGAPAAPAAVEPIEGTELNRITLVESAAARIGLDTAPVRAVTVDGTHRLAIPYAAILYTPDGQAWVYTNPDELVYVREAVVIDRIHGDLAILARGLAEGVEVVTTGAAELYGTETGVGGSAH
jgi:hypothetical protein